MAIRIFPLIDERWIEDTYFLRRRLEPPTLLRDEPVIEPAMAYGSVLRDRSGRWRMYYLNGRHDHDAIIKTDRFQYCEWLAESDDGVEWTCPSLGLVERDGSRDNNVIMGPHYHDASGADLTGPTGPEGFCVLDGLRHPTPHARARYTALYLAGPMDRPCGICMAYSEDGLTWTGYPENPVIRGWPDNLNNFFYDERLGHYVLYMRPITHAGPHSANRKIARAESEDLVHWSLPQVVMDTDERDADAFDFFDESAASKGAPNPPRGRGVQFYGMTVVPYRGCYLGFLQVYNVRTGGMHLELVHSPDGVRWLRELERTPFAAPRGPGHIDAGMIVSAICHSGIVVDDAHRVYCTATNRNHHGKVLDGDAMRAGILLYTQRRDRWVGYEAGEQEAELLTRPFEWDGGRLTLNAKIADGGAIGVQLENAWGHPVHEHTRDKFGPLAGPLDSLDAPVLWSGRPGIKSWTSEPLRLRFFLKHATLYAWSLPGPLES